MMNGTTKEQTKEVNTVLNSPQEKYGGERESFDAEELLSIINSVSVITRSITPMQFSKMDEKDCWWTPEPSST